MSIYKNLNRIFELQDIDYNQVVIKVKADSPLTVAQYPFITMQMAYITVTRGDNHILTVINKDGSTFSFYWGDRGHTIISESDTLLKQNVCGFILDNGILIDYAGKPIMELKLLFNPNYKKWQLRINEANYYSKTATNAYEMMEECKKFIGAIEWKSRKAQRNLTIWSPMNDSTIKTLHLK